MISVGSKWVHFSVSVQRVFLLNALNDLVQFLLCLFFYFFV